MLRLTLTSARGHMVRFLLTAFSVMRSTFDLTISPSTIWDIVPS